MDLKFGKARQYQLLHEAELRRLHERVRTDELRLKDRILLRVGNSLATLGLKLAERSTAVLRTQKGW